MGWPVCCKANFFTPFNLGNPSLVQGDFYRAERYFPDGPFDFMQRLLRRFMCRFVRHLNSLSDAMVGTLAAQVATANQLLLHCLADFQINQLPATMLR
jgi:hypothetical protein